MDVNHNIFNTINKLNEIHRYDDSLHIYYININNIFIPVISVSQIIAKCFPTFDDQKIAVKLSNSNNYQYKNKSPDTILKEWQQNRDDGTELHALIEHYLKRENNLMENNKFIDSDEFKQFKKFQAKFADRFVIIASEFRFFNITYFYGGTIDLIIYDLIDKCYKLIDLKRVKEIKKKGWCNCNKRYISINEINNNEKHLNDCELFGTTYFTNNTINCNYEKYSIQLNLYKLGLEEHGIKIGGLFLLNLYENKNYDLIPVPINNKISELFP